MKKISDWVAGAILFMRYFSYICVWIEEDVTPAAAEGRTDQEVAG